MYTIHTDIYSHSGLTLTLTLTLTLALALALALALTRKRTRTRTRTPNHKAELSKVIYAGLADEHTLLGSSNPNSDPKPPT